MRTLTCSATPCSREVYQFASGPVRAEITGPVFTPDGKALFLAVQHPGEEREPKQPHEHLARRRRAQVLRYSHNRLRQSPRNGAPPRCWVALDPWVGSLTAARAAVLDTRWGTTAQNLG